MLCETVTRCAELDGGAR